MYVKLDPSFCETEPISKQGNEENGLYQCSSTGGMAAVSMRDVRLSEVNHQYNMDV
jgi:hypothetical protein